MKICIQTLGIMCIAASLSYGEDAPKQDGKKAPDPEKAFKKLDADGNGAVSLEEFKASPRAQKNPAKAEEIFKKIDADGNAGISFKEFKAKPPHKKKKKAAGEGQ